MAVGKQKVNIEKLPLLRLFMFFFVSGLQKKSGEKLKQHRAGTCDFEQCNTKREEARCKSGSNDAAAMKTDRLWSCQQDDLSSRRIQLEDIRLYVAALSSVRTDDASLCL